VKVAYFFWATLYTATSYAGGHKKTFYSADTAKHSWEWSSLCTQFVTTKPIVVSQR